KVKNRTKALQASYEDIRLLSELGRNITSHRAPETILSSLYEGLNRIMDASSFFIGQLDEASNQMIYRGYASPDTPSQLNRRSLDDPGSLSVWSLHHQQELFLNQVSKEVHAYLESAHCVRYLEADSPRSFICIPLIFAGKALGVLVVKSFRFEAFSPQHFNILSNLASYIAIALENANAYSRIQAQDAARTRFYNNISHEFRTPLTLILSPLEELIQARQADEALVDDLEVVRKNADRIRQMITQLLEIGRLEEGQLSLSIKPVSLNSLLDRVSEAFRLEMRNKQLSFRLQKFPTEVWMHADPDKLEKILFNLLSNAVKYTPEGGHVLVKAQIDGQQVHFIVQDNGPGIPQNQMEAIFHRYVGWTELHQMEKDGPIPAVSLGIGLALVKKLVELLEGQIKVESKVGMGTTVRICLPFLPVDATPAPMNEQNPLAKKHGAVFFHSATSETVTAKEARILLVEDHPPLRAYLEQHLGDRYLVSSAPHGQAALNQLQSFVPDVILSDVMMPVMDGLTLLQQVKENEAFNHIPVILLTAHSSEAQELKGLTAGADDFISKPFSLSILHLKIKNLLNLRQNLIARYQSGQLDSPAQYTANAQEAAFLKKVFAILETDLANPRLNVDHLATSLAMSRTHLFNKLKALTGQSGKALISEFKMKKAREWLQSRQFNVAEVSRMVGYAEPKYFSQAYKRHFGHPPSVDTGYGAG
ncbi:MAG: response regulator, partial [Bacteroidota bacterium]